MNTNNQYKENDMKAININGVESVPVTETMMAPSNGGMPYVIIRTCTAGVHVGYLKSKVGQEVVLVNSRRIHYWDGAASLSQMAIDGIKQLKNSRIAMTLPQITLLQAIEIIPCSVKAQECLEGAPAWKV